MKRLTWIALLICVIYPAFSQQKASLPQEMVLVPGGIFYMGSSDHQVIAQPRHPVSVDAFYMDIHEVTNQQYHRFCMESGHRLPEFWGMDIYKSGPDYPDHPVVGVSQFDAREYADWAGKRLPTETEWEYAARGGMEGVSFPYGEKADRTKARINDPTAEKGSVKIKSYAPNAFGLYDMSGNVWEWVSDWFSESYYHESPEKNPQGPANGNFRVLRGGGWHSGPGCTTVHHRNALPTHWVDIAGGFRCVKDVEDDE